jgi:hypothetical protein
VRASALPPAFYLNCDPCREDAVAVGVQWLKQWVRDNGGTALIVTPVLAQGTRLRSSVPGLSQIRIESQATYRKSGWTGGPLLAVWPDAKMLTLLDDDRSVTAICAVPWTLPALVEWIKARRAVDLMGSALTPATPQLDPVVEVVLESLTASVNLGTALGHPMDKSRAVAHLETLRRSRYDLDPEGILAWAMDHGWSNRGAQELAEIVRGVNDGKRFKVNRDMFRPDDELMAHWREQAEKRRPK